jgi:hypothetical protein
MLLTGSAAAQKPWSVAQAPAHHGGCGRPDCPTCCKQPCQPPAPPDVPSQLMEAPVESGMYVAPPLAGSMRGAAENVGFSAGAITFPEFRLRLPHLELPCCFRGRTSAKMVFEGGEAQWQSTGFVNAYAAQNEALLRQRVNQLQEQLQKSQPAGETSLAEATAAKQAAEQYQEAMQQELKRLRCEVNRLRALEQAVQQAQQAAKQQTDCQNGSPAQAPGDYAPQAPKPVPDGGARGLQVYPARPASFDSAVVIAPLPLAPLPASGVIREPAPPGIPQARITGLRPR